MTTRKAIVLDVRTCDVYPRGSPPIDVAKVSCNGKEYYVATTKIGALRVGQELDIETTDEPDSRPPPPLRLSGN